MNTIESTLELCRFNRERLLATLETVVETGRADEVLGWRPGEGRAHIAWQLLHVGITEELFATERLIGTTPAYADLVPRFRGGSTPDDDVPTVETIRRVLAESREHLATTLAGFTEDDLEVVPEALRERGWTIGTVLRVLVWHEAHHQGQAHLTFNLWKAQL